MTGSNDLIDEALKVVDALDKARGNEVDVPTMKLRAILELLRPHSDRIDVMSIYGHKTRQPYVEIHVAGKAVTQWTPADARHHAMVTLEVAEAAEQDAFLMTLMTEKLKLTDMQATQLLQDFRGFRAAKREQEK